MWRRTAQFLNQLPRRPARAFWTDSRRSWRSPVAMDKVLVDHLKGLHELRLDFAHSPGSNHQPHANGDAKCVAQISIRGTDALRGVYLSSSGRALIAANLAVWPANAPRRRTPAQVHGVSTPWSRTVTQDSIENSFAWTTCNLGR